MKDERNTKEKRRLLVEFTEREKMYHYSLIEFLAQKFNQKIFKNTFDTEE